MNKLLNGKLVTVSDEEKSLIASEEAEVLADDAINGYKRKRAKEYPDWGTQLDYIYHNGIDKWKTDIVDPIKNKYPKP
tara:strand:+ start:589 stop:822 length:234 start_codon:yes stop_codon:yes gene_type:complete